MSQQLSCAPQQGLTFALFCNCACLFAQKKAVEFVEEVGSRSLKGVLSPGGTTHVRLEKGDSSSEDEDEVDCRSSEEEEDFDVP